MIQGAGSDVAKSLIVAGLRAPRHAADCACTRLQAAEHSKQRGARYAGGEIGLRRRSQPQALVSTATRHVLAA